MIAAIIALVLPAAPPQLTGSEIFSKMLTKYYEAKSIRGAIEFTQTAGTAKVKVLTSVQTSKPNLFFVEQLRDPAVEDPSVLNHFTAVSDGKRMSYTVPKQFLPLMTDSNKSNVFYEPAPAGVDGGLNAFCTSLIDRSLPIALALYNSYEITSFTRRLSNLTMDDERAKLGEKEVYRLKANYAYGVDSNTGAKLQTPAYITVDKDFNLKRIVWQDMIGTGTGAASSIVSRWTVNLNIDAEPDKSLFKVK
jgi:hypothetical protein